MAFVGLYLAACLLLVCAGAAKAARPGTSARALAEVRVVPGSPTVLRRTIRLLAAAEAALGGMALVFPRPLPATLVGASYAAFAAFVLFVRAKGGAMASCGCFGTPDTPATRLHAMLNAVLAAASAGVAVSGTGGTMAGYLAHQPLDGVPLVGAGAACAWLVFHAVTTLGRLGEARRPAGPPPVRGR